MFSFFKNIRWPYRDDKSFSVLVFVTLLVPLVFSVFTKENFETIKLVTWLLFLGLGIFVWLRQKKEAGFFVLKAEKTLLLLSAVLILFGLFSSLLAPDKWSSFFGFYFRFTNSFGFLLLFLTSIFLIVDLCDRGRIDFLLKVLSVTAVIIAVKALFESFGLSLYQGLATEPFFRQSPSLLGNPNFSSMFMAGAAPFIVYFLLKEKKFFIKTSWALGLFALVAALAILASRGALLSLAVGFFVFLALWVKKSGKKKAVLYSLAGFFILGILAGTFIAISRPGILGSFSQDNISFRLIVWKQSFGAVISHPIRGVGLGNFALYHEHLQRPAQMGAFDDPHNLWLFEFATGGLIFGLGFLLLSGYGLFLSAKFWLKNLDYQALVITTSLVVFIVAASFTPVAIPCFLMLGILLGASYGLFGRVKNFSMTNLYKFFCVLLAVFFLLWSICLFSGETLLYIGQNFYKNRDIQRASFAFNLSRILDRPNQLNSVYLTYTDMAMGLSTEQIISDISDVVNAHPKISNSYVMAADLHTQLYISTKDQKFLKLAIADMKNSLLLNPFYPERVGTLGFYYFMLGDENKALDYFNQSLQMDPKLLPSLILKAKVLQDKNEKAGLMQVLEETFKFYPEDQKVKTVWFFAKKAKNIKDIPLNIYYSAQ